MIYDANHYFSKTKQLILHTLLSIQLSLPIFFIFSSVAKAAVYDTVTSNCMLETIKDIKELVNDSPIFKNSNSESSSLFQLSAASMVNRNIPASIDIKPIKLGSVINDKRSLTSGSLVLPTMDMKELLQTRQIKSTKNQFIQGATQIAQEVANDATKATVGYRSDLRDKLLSQNNRNSDWLNQYAKARIQINSTKNRYADLFLSLASDSNKLLFSQIGIRANEQQSTANLGLGYRHYKQNWMWGINSFYDYNINKSSTRFGIGCELWAYYLKLVANGYFSLTDLDQLILYSDNMHNYNAQPANGFDIRAEGYLPSYPNLGGYVRYEQYFGNDIVTFDHDLVTVNLKDKPFATTFGLTYTPFPLLTLKTQMSNGDPVESLIGVEFVYRFGIPLAAQLNPDNINLIRNLAVGNRYDFVDRNYDIVMQRREQEEILAISLPKNTTAEANRTITINAMVQKAKYGLNKILWNAPELVIKGGKIDVVSPTSINLTLPSSRDEEGNQGSDTSYALTAIGIDNKGNKSKAAVMMIYVTQSKGDFSYFFLENPTPVVADGNQSYLAEVRLQTDEGAPLINKQVTFAIKNFDEDVANNATRSVIKNDSADVGTIIIDRDGQKMVKSLTETTDTEGKINIKIKSNLAGQGNLIATTVNGIERKVAIKFIPDANTTNISGSNDSLTKEKLSNPLPPNVDGILPHNKKNEEIVLSNVDSKIDAQAPSNRGLPFSCVVL